MTTLGSHSKRTVNRRVRRSAVALLAAVPVGAAVPAVSFLSLPHAAANTAHAASRATAERRTRRLTVRFECEPSVVICSPWSTMNEFTVCELRPPQSHVSVFDHRHPMFRHLIFELFREVESPDEQQPQHKFAFRADKSYLSRADHEL